MIFQDFDIIQYCVFQDFVFIKIGHKNWISFENHKICHKFKKSVLW